MKKIAFMFPGQGSQHVGMGQAFYDANEEIQELYDQANKAIGFDIQNLMFNGPAEELTSTENTQPALLLASVAAYQLLAKENVKPAMVIGHSLGEYSALVAAGALSVTDALPLVRKRGQFMEQAFPKGKGSMAAVLGLEETQIKEALKALPEEDIVDLANLNCPGQIVISGTKAGIEKSMNLLKGAGAKRVIELNVSGPFHSRLMEPASEEFEQALNQVTVNDAAIPVYANVTATEVTSAPTVKELLVKQLYSPVRFEESIRNMIEQGVDAFVEIGAGKVLCGLLRKIDRKVPTFSVQDPESLQAFLTWYREEA